MFKDLQQHNLQYQALTDEINATQKRSMHLDDEIRVVKNTLKWQQYRLDQLTKQDALNSTLLLLSKSPHHIIDELTKRVQSTYSLLHSRKQHLIITSYVLQLIQLLPYRVIPPHS